MIGEKIIYLCKQRGIPQSFIYKKIGITANGWHKMVKTGSFKFSTVVEISKILKVSLLYWLESDELKCTDQVNEPDEPYKSRSDRLSELKKKLEALEYDVKQLKSGKKK